MMPIRRAWGDRVIIVPAPHVRFLPAFHRNIHENFESTQACQRESGDW